MFIYSYPVAPRRLSEKFASLIYGLSIAVNSVSFIIVLVLYVTHASATYLDLFQSYTPMLTDNIQKAIFNCSLTATIYEGAYHLNTVLTKDTIPILFMKYAHKMNSVIITFGIAFIFDSIAKITFMNNIRNLRIHGLHVPIHFISVICAIALYMVILTFEFNLLALKSLLMQIKRTCINESIIPNHTIIETPICILIWLSVANLAVYILSILIYVIFSMNIVNDRILRLDFPWETGLLGAPSTKLLASYTQDRLEWEEKVMSIDVDNVIKTYQQDTVQEQMSIPTIQTNAHTINDSYPNHLPLNSNGMMQKQDMSRANIAPYTDSVYLKDNYPIKPNYPTNIESHMRTNTHSTYS